MRALLSVSDKTGLVELARGLAARGCELVSTGGTATALAEAGLPVLQVSDVTGFPEMMDGRVKTLHPLVHGGILARRDHADDLEAMASTASAHRPRRREPLSVRETAANPATPFDELIEEIDIGGPSMVRAAAKNFRDVLVVVDPADYARVLAALDEPGGPSLALRFDLARKAFAHTASYDTAIADELGARGRARPASARGRPSAAALPSSLYVATRKLRDAALRREPASAGGVVRAGGPRRGRPAGGAAGQGAVVHEPARSRRGARASRSSSTSRPRSSSSTRTRAAPRPARRSPRPTSARARPTRSPRSAASSAEPRDRRGDGQGDCVHVHRGGDRAVDRPTRRWPILAAKTNLRVVIAAVAFGLARGQERGPRRARSAHGARRRAGPGAGSRRPRRMIEWPRADGPEVVTTRAADRRRVEGAALRVARLRAREVEHRHLHRRRPHAGGRRRADEPRGRGEGGGDEGRAGPRSRSPDRSPRRTRSSRSATASTRSPPPAPPPSCSPAARCATPRSSPPPTSTASRWCSPAAATSGTDPETRLFGVRPRTAHRGSGEAERAVLGLTPERRALQGFGAEGEEAAFEVVGERGGVVLRAGVEPDPLSPGFERALDGDAQQVAAEAAADVVGQQSKYAISTLPPSSVRNSKYPAGACVTVMTHSETAGFARWRAMSSSLQRKRSTQP